MYVTAASEYALLEAVQIFSKRISTYSKDLTLNLPNGYVFKGKYSAIKTANKYNLVWNDEFNGTELDSSKWTVNNWTETQCSIDKTDSTTGSTLKVSGDKISVSGGAVHLGSVTEDNGNGTYKFYGSDIFTFNKMTFSHGYFEARMQLPGGVGQWSAFWANGFLDSASTNPNDYSTEIDVMENFGFTDRYQTDLHVWGNSTVNGILNEETDRNGILKYHKDLLSNVTVNSADLAAKYHVYGCEWTAESLKLYFDGNCYYTLNLSDFNDDKVNDEAVPEHFYNLINGDAMQLILSVSPAPGNYVNFAGVSPKDKNYLNDTEMTVDYVRLYQLGGKENMNR